MIPWYERDWFTKRRKRCPEPGLVMSLLGGKHIYMYHGGGRFSNRQNGHTFYDMPENYINWRSGFTTS